MIICHSNQAVIKEAFPGHSKISTRFLVAIKSYNLLWDDTGLNVSTMVLWWVWITCMHTCETIGRSTQIKIYYPFLVITESDSPRPYGLPNRSLVTYNIFVINIPKHNIIWKEKVPVIMLLMLYNFTSLTRSKVSSQCF
jgi:hypothetical protein